MILDKLYREKEREQSHSKTVTRNMVAVRLVFVYNDNECLDAHAQKEIVPEVVSKRTFWIVSFMEQKRETRVYGI